MLSLTNVPSDKQRVYKHASAAKRAQLMVSTNDVCVCVRAPTHVCAFCKHSSLISHVQRVNNINKLCKL